MQETHRLSVARGCECMGLARSAYYAAPRERRQCDAEVIEALNTLIAAHPRWGFWKGMARLEILGYSWNWKRVYRVYKAMGLTPAAHARAAGVVGTAVAESSLVGRLHERCALLRFAVSHLQRH